MARHYSTKDFFRQMPNALLARYFGGQGLFGDLDFAAMKEGKPDGLFAGWLALSDDQRNAMEAEFRDIFEMSCEKGFRAIVDEARWHLRETQNVLTSFMEAMSSLPSHYERAMVTFLDHNIFWRGARRRASTMLTPSSIGASANTCCTEQGWTTPVFSSLPN